MKFFVKPYKFLDKILVLVYYKFVVRVYLT